MGQLIPFLGPLMMGVGGVASLFGAGKGKKQEYSPVGGEKAEEFQDWLMKSVKERAERPRMVAMPNMMQKNALGGVMDFYGMPGKAEMFQPQFFNPMTGQMMPQGGPGMPNGLPSPGMPPGGMLPPGPGGGGGPGMGRPGRGMPPQRPMMRDPRMMRRF